MISFDARASLKFHGLRHFRDRKLRPARSGWDVPDWATSAAAGEAIVPNTDHIMMLENGDEFASELQTMLDRPD